MDGLTFHKIGRAYGIHVMDYERPGAGLLVSSGGGIMLAIMDAVPALRWCVDVDQFTQSRLTDWLICAERLARPIVIAGWFSISNPDPLRRAIEALDDPGDVIVYTQGARMNVGRECGSLDELFQALACTGSSTSKKPSAPLTGKGSTVRTLAVTQE